MWKLWKGVSVEFCSSRAHHCGAEFVTCQYSSVSRKRNIFIFFSWWNLSVKTNKQKFWLSVGWLWVILTTKFCFVLFIFIPIKFCMLYFPRKVLPDRHHGLDIGPFYSKWFTWFIWNWVSLWSHCNLQHSILDCNDFSPVLDLSGGHQAPAGSHPCPALSDMLPENLGHFPNSPSAFSLQLAVNPQTTTTLKDTLAIYFFPFYISSLSWLSLALCISFLSSVLYMPLCPTEWSSWSKKMPLLLFHHIPTSPLVFHLSPSRVLGHCLCVVQGFSRCNSGITI